MGGPEPEPMHLVEVVWKCGRCGRENCIERGAEFVRGVEAVLDEPFREGFEEEQDWPAHGRKTMTLEEGLNSIISDCLAGPGGDPDRCNLCAAATAYNLLKENGLNVEHEEDIVRQLTEDNVCNENFLA